MVNLTIEQRAIKQKEIPRHHDYALKYVMDLYKSIPPLERRNPITFRLTDFANWMIQNDPIFNQMFNESKYTKSKSYFLTSHRRLFETLINQLIINQHVQMYQIAPARRNKKLSTVVYKIDESIWIS